MENRQTGSCLCGRVAFELIGQFQSFYLCHCTRCQKDTGSAHAANLFSTPSNLTWLRGKELVTTYQHPNTRHCKSFCQVCGSALPTEADNFVVVPAGCLDSPVPITPTAKIFERSAAPWTAEIHTVMGYPELPD